MNPAFRRLSADLPPRRAPDHAAFPSDPKRVQAWIEALPRANQAATLRALGEAMEALAGQRLDRGRRLPALELLRPVVMEGIGWLYKQLVNTSFPLPESRRVQAEQLGALHRGLMLNYRIALVELCAPDGAVPFLRGRTVALAAERAATHASRLLRHGYGLYRGAEPGVWACLHAVHRFIASVRLLDKPVVDGGRGRSSVRQTYVHALLLAVSNPYRFTQREQDEVWRHTFHLSAHCALDARRPGEQAVPVPEDEDRGPGFVSEERAAEGGIAWLDIEPLRHTLDAALSTTLAGDVELRFKGARPLRVPIEIARKLRQSWGQAAERSHSRLGAGHRLDTVIGLSALHFHLCGGQDFDSFLRNLRVSASGGGERERAAWAHGGLDSGRSLLLPAQVMDQSLGGYRLSWAREVGVRARVGELVGLAPAADPELRTWMVGVIRWLRYNHDGSVDAGIELLSRRAAPVGLRSIDLTGTTRTPLRGIAIQPLRSGVNGAEYFVAPSVLDADALQIEVSRVVDPDAPDGGEARSERFGAVSVLENAGDYLLLNASRIETA